MVVVPVFEEVGEAFTIVSAYLRHVDSFGRKVPFLSLGLVGDHLLSGFSRYILWDVVLDQVVDLLNGQI